MNQLDGQLDRTAVAKRFVQLSQRRYKDKEGQPLLSVASDFPKRGHRVFYAINARSNRHMVFKDKLIFNSLIKGVGGAGPEDIALVRGGAAVSFKEKTSVPVGEFIDTLQGGYFCKERAGAAGRGAFALHVQDGQIAMNGNLISKSNLIAEFAAFENAVIVQRCLRQNEALNKINSSSINTLRLITLFGRNSLHSQTMGAALRIGRAKSVVDNAAAGGVFAEVDVSRGALFGEFKDKQGNTYPAHPDSSVVCAGYDLPGFAAAKTMCEFLHEVIGPQVLTIGWDVALTDEGPVIVEGNLSWDPVLHRRSDFLWHLSREVSGPDYSYLWK